MKPRMVEQCLEHLAEPDAVMDPVPSSSCQIRIQRSKRIAECVAGYDRVRGGLAPLEESPVFRLLCVWSEQSSSRCIF